MGMFDYIKESKEIPCPYCGNEDMEYQSKCGDCELAQISISEVNDFYDRCKQCDTWVQFDRVRVYDIEDTQEYLQTHFRHD